MKRITFFYLSVLILTTFISAVTHAAIDQPSARNNLNKAKQLYDLYKRYENRSQEIANLLNTAKNIIQNSSQEMDRQNYEVSIASSNRAIEILNSIPEKVSALGGADGQITPRKIQEKLDKVRSIYDLMKKYNFNNNEISNLFALAKERIKFSQTMLQEGNLKKADTLLNEAYKALFNIPRLYTREAEIRLKAVNKLFMAQILVDFTKMYYVNDIKTKGEFRRVLFWLNKTQSYLDSSDYSRFDVALTRTQESMRSVQQLRKKLDRENNIRQKRCGDAQYMILFAEIVRKRNSEQLQAGGMTDLFTLARNYLEKAKNALQQGRCKEALQNATEAVNSFHRVKTFRKDVIRYKKMAEAELIKAESAYQKAIRTRLPFDAVEQVKHALNEINRAKTMLAQYEYQQAYNVLVGANMILKSLVD